MQVLQAYGDMLSRLSAFLLLLPVLVCTGCALFRTSPDDAIGNFSGDWTGNASADIYGKSFGLQSNTTCDKLVLRVKQSENQMDLDAYFLCGKAHLPKFEERLRLSKIQINGNDLLFEHEKIGKITSQYFSILYKNQKIFFSRSGTDLELSYESEKPDGTALVSASFETDSYDQRPYRF